MTNLLKNLKRVPVESFSCEGCHFCGGPGICNFPEEVQLDIGECSEFQEEPGVDPKWFIFVENNE